RFSRDWSSDVCSSDLTKPCAANCARPVSLPATPVRSSGRKWVCVKRVSVRNTPSVKSTDSAFPRRPDPAQDTGRSCICDKVSRDRTHCSTPRIMQVRVHFAGSGIMGDRLVTIGVFHYHLFHFVQAVQYLKKAFCKGLFS